MKLSQKSSLEFTELLSSKAAVPGGGGAAALVGALGTALGGMVCNLTIGKKKYAEFEEEIKLILEDTTAIQDRFLDMIDEDAENFIPLSKAYGLPITTEEERKHKEEVMEESLKKACEVPIEIMRVAYKAIELHQRLVDKGSKLAISDVGVGVQCLRAALLSGELNVKININMIKDKSFVEKVNLEMQKLSQDGIKIADEVYIKVLERIW